MRGLLPIVIAIASLHSAIAEAQLSKEACVDAHSRGQDAREQGKLSLARKLFLSCAQNACPAAVQSDCARFADDLTNMQPTVVFGARDGSGNDLPNTSVYVDGTLVATTIDGKPHDLDPGNHVIKFSSGGKDQVLTVVIGSGEKSRSVQARFGAATPPPPPVTHAASADRPAVPTKRTINTTHPDLAVPLAIGGGIVTLGGTVLALWGRHEVPANCELSTRQCAAPPGDPVFDDARSAAKTMNSGIIIATVGATALIGGLVWYVASEQTVNEKPAQQALAPWVSGDGGGVSVLGRF